MYRVQRLRQLLYASVRERRRLPRWIHLRGGPGAVSILWRERGDSRALMAGLRRLAVVAAAVSMTVGCASNHASSQRREEINDFLDSKEQVEPLRKKDEPAVAPPQAAEPGADGREHPSNLPVVVLKPHGELQPEKATSPEDSGLFLLRSEVKKAVVAGTGRLLGFVRVRPHSMKRRFLGFEIVELRASDSRFQPPHIRPGDVILQINGIRMKSPENLFDALQTLRFAPSLEFDIWREEKRVIVAYTIREDPVAGETP